jgi:hypothetical protein
VLIQYLRTLAISDGFYSEEMFEEIKSTSGCFEINKKNGALKFTVLLPLAELLYGIRMILKSRNNYTIQK